MQRSDDVRLELAVMNGMMFVIAGCRSRTVERSELRRVRTIRERSDASEYQSSSRRDCTRAMAPLHLIGRVQGSSESTKFTSIRELRTRRELSLRNSSCPPMTAVIQHSGELMRGLSLELAGDHNSPEL